MSNYLPDAASLGYDTTNEGAAIGHEPDRAGRRYYLIFIGAFIWGLLTAFSLLIGGEGAVGGVASIVDGVAMTVALILVLAAGGTFASVLNNAAVWLFLVHCAVGATSSFVMSPSIYYPLKMLLLLPALGTLVAVAGLGWRAVNSLRAGLTLSGVIFAIYHFSQINFSTLTDPHYRLYLFLNSNGVAYICMITGLSLLEFAIRRLKSRRGFLGTVTLLACLLICAVVCFSTKSRTAALAFVVGVVFTVMLATELRRFILWAVAAVVFALIAGAVLAPDLGGNISDAYQLRDAHRSIDTGTGRFDIWQRAITVGFLPHFMIGMGPGAEYARDPSMQEIGNVHNAMLAMLVNTGILGTLPILILLYICFRRSIATFRDPRFQFAIIILFSGFLESNAEALLFSIGNPAGLLFILSVAILTSRNLTPDAAGQESGFTDRPPFDPAYMGM
jgi:O-antigen ligase